MSDQATPESADVTKAQGNPVHGAIGCVTMIVIAVVIVAMCRGGGNEQAEQGDTSERTVGGSTAKVPEVPDTAELVAEAAERLKDRLGDLPASNSERASALERIRSQFNTEFREAIAPLEAQLDQERYVTEHIKSRFVRLAIVGPKEVLNGYQGTDGLSDRVVYVETTRHKPRRIGGTLNLTPIMGEFVQDGEVGGQNAFGGQVRIPRFVDAPDREAVDRHYVKLRDEYKRWEREYRRLLRTIDAAATQDGAE